MNLTLKTPTSFSHTFSASKHLRQPKPPFSFKPYSTQAVEHVVLFKVKDDTEPSKVNAMVKGLNSLVCLDQVLHLTGGPLQRNRSSSSSLNFTHMLHSRHNSKNDLADYSAHPSHLGVVRGSVLPICDDIMAVDWVAEDLSSDLSPPPPGSVIRVSFFKLKEDLGDEIKNEVLEGIRGIKENVREISQISFGENFSPERAKGFSLAWLAVFKGPKELEAVDSYKELESYEKKGYVESVLVVDYVVPLLSA